MPDAHVPVRRGRKPGAGSAGQDSPSPWREPFAWVLFGLSVLSTVLAFAAAILSRHEAWGSAAVRDALARAGATPGLLLAIAAVALAGGLCLLRLARLQAFFEHAVESHRELLDKSEALGRSFDELKHDTDLARVDRFAAQLGQARAEISTLRSEIETRVLPAPELRRAFEEQGNKFAEMGKFLHRMRAEWLEQMRASLEPICRQGDVAALQSELRRLTQHADTLATATDVEGGLGRLGAALAGGLSKVASVEESLARTEVHFGSVETYLGSVADRLDGSFRDLLLFLEEERKRRPADFREEWAKAQSTLTSQWERGLAAISEEIGHRKEEARHEIRAMLGESKKEIREVMAGIEGIQSRLEFPAGAAAQSGAIREILEAEREAAGEVRQALAAFQETLAQISRHVERLPRKEDLSQASRETVAEVEREFDEVRRRLESRLASIEEFRGGLTGLAEESRRIRESLRQVESMIHAARPDASPPLGAPALAGSGEPSVDPGPPAAGPALEPAAAAGARGFTQEISTDSVQSAIEKLRRMKDGA